MPELFKISNGIAGSPWRSAYQACLCNPVPAGNRYRPKTPGFDLWEYLPSRPGRDLEDSMVGRRFLSQKRLYRSPSGCQGSPPRSILVYFTTPDRNIDSPGRQALDRRKLRPALTFLRSRYILGTCWSNGFISIILFRNFQVAHPAYSPVYLLNNGCVPRGDPHHLYFPGVKSLAPIVWVFEILLWPTAVGQIMLKPPKPIPYIASSERVDQASETLPAFVNTGIKTSGEALRN